MTTAKKGNKKTTASNSVNVLTVAQLQQAVVNANQLYIQRNGSSAVVNKNGFNKDIARAYKMVSEFSNAQLQDIAQLGINDLFLKGLTDASSSKKPMRIAGAALFVLTGSGKHCKSSVKTFFLEFLGIVACGAKNRSGMRFCATGKGSEHTSDEVYSTAKARKLLDAFGVVSVGSEGTQSSVGFSAGGIGESLGCAKKDSRNGMPVINTESLVLHKLNMWVSQLTDGAIELLVAQSNEKK